MTVSNPHTIGEALVYLSRSDEKRAAEAELSYSLKGKLYKSRTGWILMSVPNALGRGAFDALNETGAELPTSETTGQYNAHVSVMRPEELESVTGGADAITERGHEFGFTLGPVRSVVPDGWGDVAKCWFIEIRSPELEKLRKSYGMTALPNDDKYKFHMTFAIKKKGITQPNAKSKAASLIHHPPYQEKRAAPQLNRLYGGVEARGAVSPASGDCGSRPAALSFLDLPPTTKTIGCDGNLYTGTQSVTAPCSFSGRIAEKAAADAILPQLQQAKAYSDARRYSQKAQLLRKLILESPQDWEVDQPRPRYPGITHRPTNFQFHLPREMLPPSLADSHYAQAATQVPIQIDPRAGVVGNIQQNFGRIRQRGDRRIRELGAQDDLANAADPGRSLRQLQTYAAGKRKPIVSHPLDVAIEKGAGFRIRLPRPPPAPASAPRPSRSEMDGYD